MEQSEGERGVPAKALRSCGTDEAGHVAGGEQRQPGETAGIVYEDASGRWHAEVDSGDDRPNTSIDD